MPVNRRQVVSAIGLGGLMLPALARAATMPATPMQTLGPFYPVTRPDDQDIDLTMLEGHTTRALGEVIEVSGRTLYTDGTPAAGVVLDLWQANAAGRYDNLLDTSGLPLDPNFQGSALLTTGADGTWRVTTVLPGAYPIPGSGMSRTRHIHFTARSQYGLISTQMYFPGEPLNQRDILLGQMDAGAGALLTSTAAGKRADGIARYTWDVVLDRAG